MQKSCAMIIYVKIAENSDRLFYFPLTIFHFSNISVARALDKIGNNDKDCAVSNLYWKLSSGFWNISWMLFRVNILRSFENWMFLPNQQVNQCKINSLRVLSEFNLISKVNFNRNTDNRLKIKWFFIVIRHQRKSKFTVKFNKGLNEFP